MLPKLSHFFQLLQMDIKIFLTDVKTFFKKPPAWAIVIFAVCLYFIPLPLSLLYFGIMGSIEYTYPLYQPADTITEICLIEFQDETYQYFHGTDDIPVLPENNGACTVALDPEDFSSFLEDFETVPCRKWVNDPDPSIEDGTVLIQYADGSQEWLCASGTFIDSINPEDGTMTWYYFDQDSFDALLASYGFQPSQ
ncbi:MAG: hypothetical protein IJ001_09425 [Oscillospiraceae bacterium]|nr:hypothetical protein [Oscillospiraceae bacterium]